MAVETSQPPESPLMQYGKRLLMALGLAAPFLAWALKDTVPYRCYEAAVWGDPIPFCALLYWEGAYLIAGGIVLVAFVAPTAYHLARPRLTAAWASRSGGDD